MVRELGGVAAPATEAAAVWLKEHRKDTSMVATQAHLLRRDVKAWLPLLEDYRSATGDGRAH
jgi:hypothetical protein